MSNLSVLLIGAGGSSFGQPLVDEFIRQRQLFRKVAILARPGSSTQKFELARQGGIEIIVGSFLDPRSYQGAVPFVKRLDHRELLLT